MVYRLVPKSPTPSDLLGVAEEMSFFALSGEDEKTLKLLREALPNYAVVESGTTPKL
jgi:hypothetical protein